MEIINGLANLHKKYPRPVVTIGIFDGLHRGHQNIISKVMTKARGMRGTGFVITFHPHPLMVLRDKEAPRLLTSLKYRISYISKLGVDVILLLRFSKRFSKIEPEDFVKDILVDKIGAHYVIVGEDFLFGYKHKGDASLLKGLGSKFGFKTFVASDIKISDDVVISSTLLRRTVAEGNLAFARRLLGRDFSIQGTVIKGQGYAGSIGYPTANLNLNYQQIVIPPDGVYAVKVVVEGRDYCGILNIGKRPTFGTFKDSTAEVHIIDFNRYVYGKTIEIVFLKRLRDEKKFPSRDNLARQIKKDEQLARALYLDSHPT